MLDKSWGLTFGMTYDYYTVKNASATTHQSESFYKTVLQQIWDNNYVAEGWTTEADMYANDSIAAGIADMYASCGNSWTCTFENEINSFYRSIGVRVGVVGKF